MLLGRMRRDLKPITESSSERMLWWKKDAPQTLRIRGRILLRRGECRNPFKKKKRSSIFWVVESRTIRLFLSEPWDKYPTRQCGILIQRTFEARHFWKHNRMTENWAKNPKFRYYGIFQRSRKLGKYSLLRSESKWSLLKILRSSEQSSKNIWDWSRDENSPEGRYRTIDWEARGG